MSTPTNTDLETTFFTAVKRGDTAMVTELATATPDLVHAYDYSEFGAPCINLACGHRNNLDMVKHLIVLGANVNQKSDWEPGPWSPALLAVGTGDMTIAHYLVEHGATVDVHLAAALPQVDTLIELLDNDPTAIHTPGGDGCVPLHFAATPDVVDCLLERGADLEARDNDHYSTPAQWAASQRPLVARHLFVRGATPDIFSAVMSGATTIVRQLLTDDPALVDCRMNRETFPPGAGLDVDNIMTVTVGLNATPLHAAANGNQAEMIPLLTCHGGDVNCRGAYDNCTPLHLTAWNDHVEAAAALLEAGADIDVESGEIHQNTPIGWAIVAGSVNVVKLLLERGCASRDYYCEHADHGYSGGFAMYKHVSIDNYAVIGDLLKTHFR